MGRKKRNYKKKKQKKADCIICLEDIFDSDYEKASHHDIVHTGGYHKECWERFLEKYQFCPLCRMDLIEKPQLEYREQNIRTETQFLITNHDIERHYFIVQQSQLCFEVVLFLSLTYQFREQMQNNAILSLCLKNSIAFYLGGRYIYRNRSIIFYNILKYLFILFITHQSIDYISYQLIKEIDE